MSETPPPRDFDVRGLPWLGLATLALAGAGFVLLADLRGAIAAVVLGVAWYALPAPYAVAVGHLLLVALLPPESGIEAIQVVGLVPVEAGLLGLLATAAPRIDAPARFAVALVVATAVLVGVAALGFLAGGVPGAAAALAVVAGVLGYGLHRYERLRLGLIEAPPSDSRIESGSDTATGPETDPTIES